MAVALIYAVAIQDQHRNLPLLQFLLEQKTAAR